MMAWGWGMPDGGGSATGYLGVVGCVLFLLALVDCSAELRRAARARRERDRK